MEGIIATTSVHANDTMGMFDKVKKGLKTAAKNADDEIDLDEDGAEVETVAAAISYLRKKKREGE